MARIRAWLATTVSVLSLVLLVLTAVVPDWVEVFFRVAPDDGDGSLEAIIALALLAVSVVSGALAGAAWQAVRRGAAVRGARDTGVG